MNEQMTPTEKALKENRACPQCGAMVEHYSKRSSVLVLTCPSGHEWDVITEKPQA